MGLRARRTRLCLGILGSEWFGAGREGEGWWRLLGVRPAGLRDAFVLRTCARLAGRGLRERTRSGLGLETLEHAQRGRARPGRAPTAVSTPVGGEATEASGS